MGVLELFGTLIKNDITATAIRSDYRSKVHVNHLFLDFNSIIHVASQRILKEINSFFRVILKSLYGHKSVQGDMFMSVFKKYDMLDIQKKIKQDTAPEIVIKMFKKHFTEEYLDKLIITLVINSVKEIVTTFCMNSVIETLMLAIDGVPSKGKLIEGKQRRYMGAIMEIYKKDIFTEYTDYLIEQPDYIYLASKHSIKWSRNKITPGTAFMHTMVRYLRSEKIQKKLKVNRPDMKIILSDMYEVGEGEKKIVNYVNKYLANTTKSVMIYSPDTDVVLLCMLLPVQKLYMLRYDQQTSGDVNKNVYDLIDIKMLKANISFYINNHPSYSKEKFDIDRINYDIVCISTLFGNDFVPKMETLNVKKGFQNIMDAYLRALLKLKHKNYYLVKNRSEDNSEFRLNFTFLKFIMRELLPEEEDFIKHNRLYAEYITVGKIKNVFDYMEINAKNIVSTVISFKNEYEELQRLIKNNGRLLYFETNDQFMSSLKKCISIKTDGVSVNTTYLTNKEMIDVLKSYYSKTRQFPRLDINLNTWSRSINDHIHKMRIKGKNFNDYDKETYKFEHMLDEYYIKFNAQPLVLTRDKIDDYYETNFGIKINGSQKLSKEAMQVMHDYVEGILWVFNYYFNDTSYLNTWYYEHERAPLIKHILMFLDSISREYFVDMYKNLKKYQVTDIKKFFNPLEQFMYVSPMTPDIIKLLPSNYRNYIRSDDLDPFLQNYFINVTEITDKLWNEKVSKDVDCHSIPYFNKCFVKTITKPTTSDDVQFLKAIRKVKPNETSARRSQSKEPGY